jgi:AbrB family looped-hinge helix DNA binding protein
MTGATVTISSKGRVTLPSEVRAALGARAGDRLDFIRLADGSYAIVPATRSIRALKGVLPRREQAVSLLDVDAAVEAGAKGE